MRITQAGGPSPQRAVWDGAMAAVFDVVGRDWRRWGGHKACCPTLSPSHRPTVLSRGCLHQEWVDKGRNDLIVNALRLGNSLGAKPKPGLEAYSSPGRGHWRMRCGGVPELLITRSSQGARGACRLPVGSRSPPGGELAPASRRAVGLGVYGHYPMTGIQQRVQAGNREVRRSGEYDLERRHLSSVRSWCVSGRVGRRAGVGGSRGRVREFRSPCV